MVSNLSSLGFAQSTQEEDDDFLDKILASDLLEYETDKGSYLCWRQDESFGPEIWLQGIDGNIIALTPYFRGKSKATIALTKKIEDTEESPLYGLVHAYANPTDENESGDYPFAFEMTCLQSYKFDDLPLVMDISLSAICQGYEYWDNEEAHASDLRSKAPEEPIMASESFIPTGLFTDEENPYPAPIALLTGRILETKKIKNTQSGNEFYWALVQSYGISIDVVIDPYYVKKKLKKGGIISGSFYLSGDLCA
jgi:hypothetical protein